MTSSGQGDVTIPNFAAAALIMRNYLTQHLPNGWLFRKHGDGHLYPYLVTSIRADDAGHRDQPPHLTVGLMANGRSDSRSRGGVLGPTKTSVSFFPEDLTRKKVSNVLDAAGLFIETVELHESYGRDLTKYQDILANGFTDQYRYTGQPMPSSFWQSENVRSNAKVIHDIASNEIGAFADYAPSVVITASADDADDAETIGAVPTHFALRVFDLRAQTYIWVNTLDLSVYVYDKSLQATSTRPPGKRAKPTRTLLRSSYR